MRHRKERLQVRERPLVDAADQALQRAEQATVGQEHHRQDRCQRRRQDALLDGQAAGRSSSSTISIWPDTQAPTSMPADLLRISDADGVDRQLGAIAEGDDVAVGGEALPEAVGHVQALLARAQQDFRAAQRAGGQHHHVGASTADGRSLRIAAARNAPASRRPWLWRLPHLGVREDLRAMPHGGGQIGQCHRVLGADVAAAAAVAAARAGRLCDAGGIDGLGSKLTTTGAAIGALPSAMLAACSALNLVRSPPCGSRAGRSQRSARA